MVYTITNTKKFQEVRIWEDPEPLRAKREGAEPPEEAGGKEAETL
jgi:hypothetical protein